MKYILITGVSSGIGFGIAKDLIKHGYGVIGSVRKNEDLQRVKKILGPNFFPILLDVTKVDEISNAANDVEKIIGIKGLSGLINNAGISCPGPLLHVNFEQYRHQFDVNVWGVLNCTKAFFPFLKSRNNKFSSPGRIINISSVSGRLSFPFLGLYSASKHALESLSDALRRELSIYGIDVIVIQPGSTQSLIWDKIPDTSQFNAPDYEPYLKIIFDNIHTTKEKFMPVSKICKIVRTALTKKKPKTRYLISNNKLRGVHIPRILPDRLLDRIIFKKLNMKI